MGTSKNDGNNSFWKNWKLCLKEAVYEPPINLTLNENVIAREFVGNYCPTVMPISMVRRYCEVIKGISVLVLFGAKPSLFSEFCSLLGHKSFFHISGLACIMLMCPSQHRSKTVKF